jgi:pimeloyl-ACP methyl ester carboxylesterase
MAYHWLGDGVPLWYEELGQGPALVLLQGLQFPAGYFWQKNAAALAAAGNRVIMLDLRGQGLSGKPAGDHSVARNAADLAEFLDARAITEAMLLGVAFGGIAALEYLRTFGPKRLRALGLCEMSPRVMSANGWDHPTFGDFPPEAARGYGAGVRADRTLLDGFLDAAFADPLDPAVKAEMKAQMYLTPTETVAAIIDDMVEPDFRDFLPQIALPTLLVYGRRNNPVMPGRVGAWMAERIPDVELVELEGGGHSVFWEDPAGFNAAVADFAGRH